MCGQQISIPKFQMRLYTWILRFIGLLVPRRLRTDWRMEWEAELRSREAMIAGWKELDWKNKLDLSGHSLGALLDALWLQPRRWEDEMIQDIRFGVRMLVKNPSFTLAAVLSLVIGIGACSAIFSVVNGVLLRPLPFREPERLVQLWEDRKGDHLSQIPASGGAVKEWRLRAQSFSDIAAFYTTEAVFVGDGLEPERVLGAEISANLFPMLGLEPMLGRRFQPEENRTGINQVIMLSHKLWQSRYGADPAIVGKTIKLDLTRQYSVIGVMPPGVTYPGRSEFWRPETKTDGGRHDIRMLNVVARLKPGATISSAESELELINKQLRKEYPEAYREWGVEMMGLHESVVGKTRLTLLTLLGAVGFLLLIACANVANLLLARAIARGREMAVRAALGAGRLRLIRQLLTESALLSLLGAAGGLILAQWTVRAFVALKPPGLPRLDQISVDVRVLGFTVSTAVIVSLVFGLAAAWRASKPDLTSALKDATTVVSSRTGVFRRIGLRGSLAAGQLALALILMAGAGLMIRSMIKLRQVELGFNPTHTLSMEVSPLSNGAKDETFRAEFYRRLIDSLRSVPGVNAVSGSAPGLAQGAMMSSPILIAGRPKPDSPQTNIAFLTITNHDFLQIIGNPILQGRYFNTDDKLGGPRVAIINQTMARRYFPNGDAVGQRFALIGEPQNLFEIVGVAADVKQFGLIEENKPNFYLPSSQREVWNLSLILRTNAAPSTLIPLLRRRVREVDSLAVIGRIREIDEIVSDSIAQSRFYTLLLSVFAGVSLALAAIGIYGVMAYSVSQRTHEIGVRMALGAERGRVLRMVLSQGMRLALFGVAAGLVGALGLTRVLQTLLFKVQATDPITFGVVAMLLAGVAFLACLVPAQRATRVDPLLALRRD